MKNQFIGIIFIIFTIQGIQVSSAQNIPQNLINAIDNAVANLNAIGQNFSAVFANPTSPELLPALLLLDGLLISLLGYDPYVPIPPQVQPVLPIIEGATQALGDLTVVLEDAIEYTNATWQTAQNILYDAVNQTIFTLVPGNLPCDVGLKKSIVSFVKIAIGDAAYCIINEMNVYDSDLHAITRITKKANNDMKNNKITLNLVIQIAAATQKISVDVGGYYARPSLCVGSIPARIIFDSILWAIKNARC